MIFSEVNLVVENDTVVIRPVGKKIEANANTKIVKVNLSEEKANILKDHNKRGVETNEYRPSKYNRRK